MYVREFFGYKFLKGMLIGYLDGNFLGKVNGCELRASDGFPGKFQMDSGWVIWKEVWQGIIDGT